MTVVYLKIDGV